MRTPITVSGVSERDVDLLLLEEFIASEDFVHWFANAAGLECPVSFVSGARSVTESIGESDIEISLAAASGEGCRLLIENKIGAAFQPRQSERYRERGAAYVKRRECDTIRTVLVAPASYVGDHRSVDFDAFITYEAIADWFESRADLGRRAEYKLTILRAAIEKAIHGYQAIADAPVTDFWHSYWQAARELAPELEMEEPIGKPAGAGFVYFRPSALGPGVAIVHKLRHGFLDLQFAGMASQLSALHGRFGARLLPEMRIAKAEKSGVIRQVVPKFQTNEPFVHQQGAAVEVLRRARALLHWFQDVGAHSESAV